jgi:hypothetical protein
MTTSASSLSVSASRDSSNWLISRKEDWIWVLGGAITSYFILAAFIAGLPIVPLSFAMLVALEGPHVFATATRSYLDPEARKQFGWFLWLIVPLTLIGPVVVWFGFAQLFFVFAFCWLHFHIAKQHVGFTMLYKRKAGEFDDVKSDRYFLLVALSLPPMLFFAREYLANIVIIGVSVVFFLIAGLYALGQVTRQRIVWPKLYLMLLVIPLQWLAFGYAGYSGKGLKVAGILISLGHSLQYHKLTRLYHKAEEAETGQKKLWHSLGGYLVVVLTLNLVFNVIPRGVVESDYVFAALWGMSFQHYILDGRLWKTKNYPLFRKALGI